MERRVPGVGTWVRALLRVGHAAQDDEREPQPGPAQETAPGGGRKQFPGGGWEGGRGPRVGRVGRVGRVAGWSGLSVLRLKNLGLLIIRDPGARPGTTRGMGNLCANATV